MIGGVVLLVGGFGGYTALKENTELFDSASKRCQTAMSRTYSGERAAVEAALGPCAEAVEDEPRDVESLYALGRLHNALGSRDAAISALQRGADQGHGESTLELAIITRSPAMLKKAVQAFKREAEAGAAYEAFAYARVNLWADDFELKPHETLLSDGTYMLFLDAGGKGALREISNLAFEFSDPSKRPGNPNATTVADALRTIASEQGYAAATAGLAQRAFVRSRMAAAEGLDNAASSGLDDAERLARLALKQAGGKEMTAGLLLEDIKEVRQRPARMWASILGALFSGGGSRSSDSDKSEGEKYDEYMEQQRQQQAEFAEKQRQSFCDYSAFAADEYDIQRTASGC